MKSGGLLLRVALLAWLLAANTEAQDVRQHELAKNAAGEPAVTLEIESVYSKLPLHGYAPVRVTVTNKSQDPIIWNFGFIAHASDDRSTSNFELKAKNAGTTNVEFMVPVPTEFGSGSSGRFTYGHELEYTATAYSLPTRPEQSGQFSGGFPSDWPAIAMSKDAGVRNLGPLESELASKRSYGSNHFAATFEPKSLPSDWRGYSGLDVVVLTDTEWQALLEKTPSICHALLEWNRLGGQLDIYTSQGLTHETLGIEGMDPDNRRSLGRIDILPWNGREFNPQEMVNRYDLAAKKMELLTDSKLGQGMIAGLGKRAFGSWQVAVILIAFGIIVGPVNLFVFAKPGRRHRLFFTTPIISLGASLLLLLLIFLQDGMGGNGIRFAFVNVEPDETAAFVNQFQVARTGVLFSSAFEAQKIYASQTVIGGGTWAAVDDNGGQAKRYSLEGAVFGGDWFQSRREHGHHLQAVRSTRGRIEIVSPPGNDPVIVSSFGFDLRRAYYTDLNGKSWRSPGAVKTGERVALQSATPTELRKSVITDFMPDLGSAAKPYGYPEFLAAPGKFVALADEADDLVIHTLGSIAWNDKIVLCGPVTGLH